jgi:hypothetical protein
MNVFYFFPANPTLSTAEIGRHTFEPNETKPRTAINDEL